MKDRSTVLGTLTLILQLGIIMLVPIVSLTILGAYLNDKYDMAWLPVVMFFVGAIGGAQGAYRVIRGVIRDWSYDARSAKSIKEAKEKRNEGA